MNIFIANYKEIIALIGSLTGFLGLGITFYSKYRDSNIRDKELELKKEQFDLEKKHQISKEKYQELFELKIDVYRDLYTEINKFRKQLYDVGKYLQDMDQYGQIIHDEITVEDVSVASLLIVFKKVQENHFVISNQLMDKFYKLYDFYRKFTAEFDFLLDVGAIHDPKDEWKKISDSFYQEYKELIDDFFNQIEQETRQIKLVLESN